MRRIIVFDRITADGYFAAPDGNLSWAVPDDDLDRAAAANTGQTGAMLFGRRTYEMFESFWRHALDDSPLAPNPHGDERSRAMHAIATWINNAEKVVFSKTLKNVTWNNARLLHKFDAREIEAMKSLSGTDIMIFGSGTVVSQLTDAHLIDEYRLVVNPVILGGGRSLISNLSKSFRLELLEAQPYASGNVMLRYAPVR